MVWLGRRSLVLLLWMWLVRKGRGGGGGCGGFGDGGGDGVWCGGVVFGGEGCGICDLFIRRGIFCEGARSVFVI